MKYTSENILDGRLGRIFWKSSVMNVSYWNIQYSELFAPEASVLVQNAPKSLALGLRPRPRWGSLQRSPDPLAVMGWDGDLVTTFFGVNYVPPCLVAGAPCCIEAGYGLLPSPDWIWISAVEASRWSPLLCRSPPSSGPAGASSRSTCRISAGLPDIKMIQNLLIPTHWAMFELPLCKLCVCCGGVVWGAVR